MPFLTPTTKLADLNESERKEFFERTVRKYQNQTLVFSNYTLAITNLYWSKPFVR
ncbi:UNVERIFIED_CONTAM: hypothetical protein FKN15_032695 [Acipenser sinensis]